MWVTSNCRHCCEDSSAWQKTEGPSCHGKLLPAPKCYTDFWLMTVDLTHAAKLVFCCVCVLSHVHLFVTPWTVARQAPLSMETSQARILEWIAISSFKDLPDSGTELVSLAFPTLVGRFFTASATKESERNTNFQIEERLKNNKVFG